MLRVLQPRLPCHGRAPLRRPKVIEGCVRQHGHRRLSTTAEPAKPSSPAAEEPGWPLKYKVAGGAILGTIIPYMFSYAMANDPGSRRLVSKLSPGIVQWFRQRQKGGHFFDEDPKRLEYLAHVSDWINEPVSLEIRTGSGETRRLDGLDAQTPFSSVGRLVQGGGWLTDFDVLDEGDTGDGEAQSGQISATWDISSSGASSASSYQHESSSPYSATSANSSSGVATAVRRDVAACNIRSWWDIAALEQERARQPAPLAAVAGSASSSGSSSARAGSAGGGGSAAARSSVGTVGAARGSSAKKMSNAEQARAMIEHLDEMVEALERDKLTGVRSVDDVEEEVRELRRQQKELRRKHPGRRRFLGLF
ncbi:unnamed protein product [Ectocarpus sp. 12 AP-2014]